MITTRELPMHGRCCVGCGRQVFTTAVVEGRQWGHLFSICKDCEGKLLDHRDALACFVGELVRR